MARVAKETATKEETFDLLDIRLGRVMSAELDTSGPHQAYRLSIDFGKFGTKSSVGRFSCHSSEEIVGKLVLGVLNFPARQVGDTLSEVLVLGVQFPKADSGEATFLTPANEGAKLGGKVF